MAKNNVLVDSRDGAVLAEELELMRAEIEVAKAEAVAVKADAAAIKADADATKAEAEALLAEAEALMAEAKAMKAEAEALMAEAEAIRAEAAMQMSAKKLNVSDQGGHNSATYGSTHLIRSPQETRSVSEVTGSIAIASMADDEKLPKDRIVLYHDEYKTYGVTNFRTTAVKGSGWREDVYFDITGEFDAKTKNCLLMVIMVFNAKDELIGVDFDERIEEERKRHKTYSTRISLPNDERISRIEVRIINDPVSVE